MELILLSVKIWVVGVTHNTAFQSFIKKKQQLQKQKKTKQTESYVFFSSTTVTVSRYFATPCVSRWAAGKPIFQFQTA